MRPTLLYKAIPLIPTRFFVDVFISDDKGRIAREMHLRYGESEEYYEKHLTNPYTAVVMDKSHEWRIVLCLPNFSNPTMVHEIIHITWKLEKFVHYGFSPKNEEIQAYYASYLFEELDDIRNNFSKYVFPYR